MPEDTARFFLSPDDPFSGSQVPFPDGTFAFTICTTAERMLAMMSVLFEGGAIMERGYIGEHNVDVLEALSNWNNPPCAETVTPDEREEIGTRLQQFVSGYGAGTGLCEECEDDMACAKPVKIGSKWYLYSDCAGCDNPLYFELTPVSVDNEGQPISVYDGGSFGGGFSSGGGASGSWDFSGVSDDNVSCYAEKATAYMLGRALEFAKAVIDWTALGVDVFAGEYDEWLEVARLTGDLIFGTGDMTEIQNLTKSQVETVFASAAVVDPLAAAWTFTGTATRSELFQWVGNAPVLSGGVPVRFLLDQWLGFSIIAGYNNDLAVLAAECESGNTIPIDDGFPTTQSLLETHDWAVVWDFHTTQFAIDGVNLSQGDWFGLNDHTEWVAGQGYRAKDGVNGGSNRLLYLIFNNDDSGAVREFHCDYTRTIAPTSSYTAINNSIGGINYPLDENFSGIRSETGLNVGGGFGIHMHADRENFGTGGQGGEVTIRRLALAGTGSNPFTGLVEV